MRNRGVLLFAILGCCWGCGTRPLSRVASGSPIPVAPLAASLKAYNQEPRAVRVQGRLRVEGRGSAVFGATSVAGEGLRLDAVAELMINAGLICLCLIPEAPSYAEHSIKVDSDNPADAINAAIDTLKQAGAI